MAFSSIIKVYFLMYNRMNARDIVKSKQNLTLYKAYYPISTINNSSIYSTIYYTSSLSTGGGYQSSITSSITTLYTYNPSKTSIPTIPFISYELSNDIHQGEYLCGNKSISFMTWKHTTSTLAYFYSTINSTISTLTSSIFYYPSTSAGTTVDIGSSTIIISTLSSYPSSILTYSTYVMSGPGPLICTNFLFNEGTNFENKC